MDLDIPAKKLTVMGSCRTTMHMINQVWDLRSRDHNSNQVTVGCMYTIGALKRC